MGYFTESVGQKQLGPINGVSDCLGSGPGAVLGNIAKIVSTPDVDTSITSATALDTDATAAIIRRTRIADSCHELVDIGVPFIGPLGVSPSLGTQSAVVPSKLAGRSLRFFLQAAARSLLPEQRVASCLRVPFAQVQVLWGLDHKKAFYGGLVTCGSVWACPVCAAKIAERRRVEIGEAIAAHTQAGGVVLLVTFTVRHHRGDDLADTLSSMLAAHRALKQGRAFQRFKSESGFVGTIRGLEATHSSVNGWHPHLHELWFLDAGADVAQVAGFLSDRWAAMLPRFGLKDVNEHGVSVEVGRDADTTLNLYVSKLGAWDLPSEMARSVTKKARGRVGRTPSAILFDFAMTGDLEDGALFAEYARVFKGRNHLRWSPGLRARLLPDSVELSDEELAAREDEPALVLATLSLSVWRRIVAHGLRAQLLEVADSGDEAAVWEFLQVAGVLDEGTELSSLVLMPSNNLCEDRCLKT